MKQPTRAGWKKLLGAYEDVINAFLPHLTDEEREKLFVAHDVLRTRASGVQDVQATD